MLRVLFSLCAAPSSGRSDTHSHTQTTQSPIRSCLHVYFCCTSFKTGGHEKPPLSASSKTVHPGRHRAESPFQNLPARTIIKQTASENLLSLDVGKRRTNDCMYQLVFEYLYLSFVKQEVGKGLVHADLKRFTEGVSSINCSCGV